MNSSVRSCRTSEIVRFRVCKYRIVENIVKNRNNLPEQTAFFINLLERRTVEMNETSILLHIREVGVNLTKFIFA